MGENRINRKKRQLSRSTKEKKMKNNGCRKSSFIKTMLLTLFYNACFHASGVTLVVGPKILPYPYADVIEAESLTLTCLYNGILSPKLVNWNMNGQHLGIAFLTDPCTQFGSERNRSLYSFNCTSNKEFTLTILQVTEQQHQDQWSCELLINGSFHNSSSTTIFVRVPVEYVIFNSSVGISAITIENNLTDFKCITSVERPRSTILWYTEGNNTPLSGASISPQDDDQRTSTVSTLRYKFTRRDDKKSLFCTANNTQLGQESTKTSNKKKLFVLYPQDEPPQIHGQSNGSDYLVIEKSVQKLVCSVSGGNPLPQLTWNCYNGTTYGEIYNNMTVEKSVNWTTTKKQRHDCICTSEHPLSGIISSFISIIVLYPPGRPTFQINTSTVDTVRAIAGRNVSINCYSDSYPPPYYTWSSTHLVYPVSSKQLSLPSIGVGKNGVYTCTTTNEMRPTSGLAQNASQSAHINLTVLYPPVRPKLKYSSQDVFETLQVILGDNILLNCTFDGNPIPVCVWKGQNSSILELRSIQPSSNGNYTCIAKNEMVSSLEEIEYGINSEQIHINVLYGPSLPKLVYSHGTNSVELNDTETLKVTEGSQGVTISCSDSAANPAPTYTWSGLQKSENGTLKLINISRFDSGSYLCHVKNNMKRTVGAEKIGYFNRSIEIDVLYPPVIEEMTDRKLLEGSTLNISCVAVSNPTARYLWTTVNQTLNVSSDAIFYKENINRGDSGIYTCTAETVMDLTGEEATTALASKQITLSVLYNATVSSFEAELFSRQQTVTIAEYDNLTLTCIVESNPLSNITIMHSNKQLKEIGSAARTSYNLHRAKCTDAGLYICSANNTFNARASTKELQLFVRCSPRPGISAAANITANLNGQAEFSLNIMAYPPPTEYMWYIYTTGSFDWIKLKNSTKYIMSSDAEWYNLTIDKLVMDDFRDYVLEVDNNVGKPYKHHFLLRNGEEIVADKTDEGSKTPAIIGGITGVIIVIFIVVAIVKYYHSRIRPSNLKNKHHDLVVLRRKVTEKSVSTQNLSELIGFKSNSQINSAFVEDGLMIDKVEETGREPERSYQLTKDKIQVTKLWDYLNLPHFYEKVETEYQDLRQGLLYSCSEANRPENGKKNRYRDMLAYDHSRVVLERKTQMESTYINANFIDGYKCGKKFIASQGPTDAMVGDFWEMILQQKTSVIVMLTNLIENRAHKCMQYWPEDGETRLFSDISVSAIKSILHPDYAIREFDVSKPNESPRRITQFHFTAWPDKAVPGTAWHLVNFWRKASVVNWKGTGPVVVHCSAGVGRTGTYIALDNLYTQAKTEGYIKPFEIVEKMRDQRVNMVQTKVQLEFFSRNKGC